MSGSYREVRDIVKTVVCSKVRFISSCSIYRLAVLPFTEETIDDISLATRLIVPLLFLSLVPSPTPPLIRLPFLLLFFDCLCFLIFFVLGWCLCSFSSSRLCASFNYKSVAGGICQPFHCSGWKVVAVAESKTWATSWITLDKSRSSYSKAPGNITMK